MSGTFASIPRGSVVNLTAQGALDWIHWGLFTETSLDRKASVSPLISDFSLVTPSNFFGFAYEFADNWNGYSWSDGTPDLSVTDTRTGVYAVGHGHGFQFSVPAGTAVQTLRVYVGTYGAVGKFQASLSDNSAPSYTDTSLTNNANGPSAVYTVTFAGRSPGSRLNLRWTASFLEDPIYGNVTLQSAALTSSTANNPPFVALTAPLDSASVSAGGNVAITATGTDFDGTIAKVEFFGDGNKLGEDSGSPYNFTWNGVPAGHHVLTVRATDNGGASSFSEPIEIFAYRTGGSLVGSVVKPPTLPTLVNLTIEGTADWVHWGARTNTAFGFTDRKAGVLEQISDFMVLGDNAVTRYGDNYTGFNWTDGMPTLTANGTTTGIYVPGLTNGFELVVPADTTTRTLKVYVGLYAAQSRLQAWLSDFSARAYADFSLSNFTGNAYGAYTLNYAAASPGQTLIVRHVARELFDFDYGNVTLQAATLVGATVTNRPPAAVRLINPRWLDGSFAFSFASQAGATYAIQFTPSLPPAALWQTLTTLSGTGSTLQFTNRNLSVASRFYRVESR